MTLDPHTPIIPTPEWDDAIFDRFWTTPYLIPTTEAAAILGFTIIGFLNRHYRGTLGCKPACKARNTALGYGGNEFRWHRSEIERLARGQFAQAAAD